MCGIAGIVSQRPIESRELLALEKMTASLRHRGPDGEGCFRDPNVALAMRRLSIIDLAGGWQPIYNEDRTLAIVANGEIYNYLELREQLESRGHVLQTEGDIETILHLYEEDGLDCVQHLRGMFAFALWDSRRRRLLLARDRMGEKPLYLYEANGTLVFSSEMRSLIASGQVPFELDANAVNSYFHYQYVPEPLTPLRGVRKLDAAHLLTVQIDNWAVDEKCYWRMEDAPALEGDAPELIRDQLDKVSALVIRSDVPVGVALSGGLDSSAIAALAVHKYPGTMHAFSVGYPGRPPYDERADARSLADYLEMPFHEIELTTSDMVSFFPELVYLRDDPIADISGFGYYAVTKIAREQNVPVLLQGQGGDELFWGYGWVQSAARESARKRLLADRSSVARLRCYLKVQLPREVSRLGLGEWVHDAGGLRTGWQSLRRDREAPGNQLVFYDLVSDFRDFAREAKRVYTRSFLAQLNGSSPTSLFTKDLETDQIDIALTQLICDTYLRENGITQGDRLAMASSIELRLPFLDYRLVETVIGLRKMQSDSRNPPKSWLKAAISDLLPDWVMSRPKRGFSPPVMEWHREIFKVHGANLADGYLQQHGVLNPESAQRLAQGEFPQNAITPLSFKALVLEMWCRRMTN